MNIEKYQDIADVTMSYFGKPLVRVVVKDVARGYPHKDYIVIPRWIQKYAEEYQIYYIVHELSHIIAGVENKHNDKFMEIEDKALDLWSLEIDRKRVYPKKIRKEYSGEVVTNVPF
ncbi:MAG: hypothetical protein N2V78_09490 [Methanophagales archaeon]|nr:hypothetical protein [Methanophagales archaeon]